MDFRVVWGMGIVLGAMAFWVYQKNAPKLMSFPTASLQMDYSAREIRLLQTTAAGQLEATTSAKALYHFTQPDRTQLDELSSRWYQDGQLRAELTASRAQTNAGYEKIQLSGGVSVTQPSIVAPDGQKSAGAQLHTPNLTGYPRQKLIVTDAPVEMHSGTSTILSQGLRADLSTGQYQLQAPRIRYVPSP